jgi:DNA-binding winged helix-turn-helix (wHTH) protein
MKEFAPFRLDPVNQCLWRTSESGACERILLTPTEFGVLDHLVARAGELVTHRELLDAVWPGTAIEPQAVKSKIFHLRRALDDDPKQPHFIETVARRGYRFVGEIQERIATDVNSPISPISLVGREDVLAELRQSLRSATAGRTQLVFVTGEPGIGKTALVEEFARQVAVSARDVRIARGQCIEGFGSKEAFYPALEAVGALCRGPDGATTIELLAAHAPTWLVQFPALLTRRHRENLTQEILGATRERMLREICEALEVIARSTPLLIVLEDVHWADASTLDLLSALARRQLSARTMVIATYRRGDAGYSPQPLNALTRDLLGRHLAREIVLRPLDQDEIVEYLATRLPSATGAEELAALLHRHTEGNPLFMIAVLEQLMERGLVEPEAGEWALRRAADEIALEVPESLRDIIGAQIEQLGEPVQRVLEVAAIASTSFSPAICAPSAHMSADSFDEYCHALARRGQVLRFADVRQLPGGDVEQRYAFVHALYREVLYDRQSPARRRLLHRERAERLEEVFATALDDVALELAHHFEKGADWTRAVFYRRRVAELAARRCDLEGAGLNFQHALALVARLPLAERGRAEIEILDALADMYLGTFDARAAEALTLLRERAAECRLVDVEAKALVDLVYPAAWESSERALPIIDEALRLSAAQADPLRRACTEARCMMRRIWTRGWSEADVTRARRALDVIRALGTPRDIAWHTIDCNLLDFFSTHYRRASRETIDALATLVESEREISYLSYAPSVREFTVPWCLIMLGDWGAALRELDEGIALAEKNGDPFRSHTLLLSRAWLLSDAMDFAGARAICESLLPELRQPPRTPWRRLCLMLAAAAEVGLGEYESALGHLLGAREEMDRRMALGDWYWRLRLQCALTDVWLARGDLARARAEGERFIAEAGRTAERSWQALACERSARIALADGELDRAQELVRRALAAIDGVEALVAAWQVQATAAAAARAHRDEPAAARYLEAGAEIVLALAGSLQPDDALRRTFLSAPPVAGLLAEPQAASARRARAEGRNRSGTETQPAQNPR